MPTFFFSVGFSGHFLLMAEKQPVRPHHAVVKTEEVEDQNLQLKDFLMFCKVKPVGYKN